MRAVSVRGGGAILAAALLISTALGREASLPDGARGRGDRRASPGAACDRPAHAADRAQPRSPRDSAGEIHRVELDGVFPSRRSSRRPRVRIPFVDARLATLGSMALEPTSRDLFLGEENGTASTAWTPTSAPEPVRRRPAPVCPAAARWHSTAPGASWLLDHADPFISPGEERPPQGLEHFRDEDYRGPLVFRLSSIRRSRFHAASIGCRRCSRGRGAGAAVAPCAAPARGGGADRRRAGGGRLRRHAVSRRPPTAGSSPSVTLPSGQHLRINMLAAPDGGVFVSGGFSVGVIFHISPDGALTRLAGPWPIHRASPWARTAISTSRSRPCTASCAFHRRRDEEATSATRCYAPSTIAAVMPRT